MGNIKKVMVVLWIVALVTILSSCVWWEKQVTNNSDDIKVENNVVKWDLLDYSESAVANAKWEIVIFFHASWCGVCVASKDDIMEKWVPENMTILIADFDTETTLKEKYWVTVQTTFVQVDNQGNMIKKWQWGKLDKILENVVKQEKVEQTEEILDVTETPVVMENTEVKEAPVSTENNEVASIVPWIYTDYSESALANAKWNVVLFFHASWCPACAWADKILQTEEIPEGLSIFKLDYDNSLDLRKKYKVTTQHTFVQIDSEWNFVSKWVWGKSVNDMLKNIK